MRISTIQTYETALNSMLNNQGKLNRTQLMLSEGKRMLTPSDDPIGSGVALNLKQQIEASGQFVKNGEVAQSSLNVTENALTSVTSILNRVRELVVQGSNDTLINLDRDSLAVEIEQRLDELVGVANTQLSDGNYIFSGFKSYVKPYSRNDQGEMTYHGDQGKHLVDVNSSVQVQTNLNGSEIFEKIPTGNRDFFTKAADSNSGTGVISTGSMVDKTEYVVDTYSIKFQLNAENKMTYQILASDNTQLVPPLPALVPDDAPLFEKGNDIKFRGMKFHIDGMPSAGDSFTIEPSTSQNMFVTLENIIKGLRADDTSASLQATMRNQLNNGLQNLDRALEQVDKKRAILGARLNVVENEKSINENINLQAKSSLSQTEDLDYASAITELKKQQVALQAAQQSFVKIEGLSLFQYL